MIMIIINRSCFSAVAPEALCRRRRHGEGRAGGWEREYIRYYVIGTLVNNYPVAGRCQKPINRLDHTTTPPLVNVR